MEHFKEKNENQIKNDGHEKESNTEKRRGEEIKAVSRHLLLYLAASLVILIVFCVTVLPTFFGGGEFLYNTGSLTILYAAISLGAAIITFAVIGDSGALLRFKKQTGNLVQLSGSAAGFAIFYYLLSSGLNPYTYLDIYLYKESGGLMRPYDGTFEVTLASHIAQSSETTKGHTTFPVPRSESDIRLFVAGVSGQLWETSDVSPEDCIEDGNRINRRCKSISVTLKKANACLSEFTISSYEAKPIHTSLYVVLDSLKENLQELSPDLPVHLMFTDAVLKAGYHKIEFDLERKNRSQRSVCEHLAAIENAFNWSQGKRVVRTYLGCNTMLVTLVNEKPGKEYQSCL